MRAVVFQHETHEGLGLLEPALKAAGFTVVKRFRGVEYHEDVEAQLVVALGGSMGVADTQQHPFLRDELAVLVERLALERPILGVCLGSQLLAAAAGGEVSTGKNGLELGVAPVRWTAAGLLDPVVKGVSAKTSVAHWHRDTWKPIPGATLLASTDRYTQQAFRLGASYGFQFHCELTADDWSRWLDVSRESLEADGHDLAALKAQGSKLKAAEHELTGLIERLVHHFAQVARAAT